MKLETWLKEPVKEENKTGVAVISKRIRDEIKKESLRLLDTVKDKHSNDAEHTKSITDIYDTVRFDIIKGLASIILLSATTKNIGNEEAKADSDIKNIINETDAVLVNAIDLLVYFTSVWQFVSEEVKKSDKKITSVQVNIVKNINDNMPVAEAAIDEGENKNDWLDGDEDSK